jgi:hypothetical protein
MPARVVFVYDDVALTSAGAVASAMSSEDSSFPKNNVILPDRKRVSRTLAGPSSPVTIDIDLGVAKPISGFGVMNFVSEAAVGARPAIEVKSGASFAGATTRFTIPGATWDTQSDLVDVFASAATFTDRFWRLSIATTTRFTIGKFIAGTGKEMFALYNNGGFDTNTPKTRLRGVFQEPIDVLAGNTVRTYAYGYLTLDATEYGILERVARQVAPFGIVDSKGNSAHVILADGSGSSFKHVFGEQWTVDLHMEQLA